MTNNLVSPDNPVWHTPFTLLAGETRSVDIPSCNQIIMSDSLRFGTSAGDVSIAFGSMGEFIRLAPGDAWQVSNLTRIQLRNNDAVSTKRFILLFVKDPGFSFANYAGRGL